MVGGFPYRHWSMYRVTQPPSADDPTVSVVMAAFNVENYVPRALNSVQRQSLQSLEIIVVDDGSTDRTKAILADHAVQDHRIRVLSGHRAGPASARNLAIANARGRWIAIVDADDLIDPDRLERMVSIAETRGVDAVADNLIAFYEAPGMKDHVWIDPSVWPSERRLTFADLMMGGLKGATQPEIGYLKPVIRRSKLKALAVPYRDELVIGEDLDLMARWTAAGLSYLYLPQAGYHYRRHASSLSYRLSPDQVQGMIDALDTLDVDAPCHDARSVAFRRSVLVAEKAYQTYLARLKSGELAALACLLINPEGCRRLTRSISEGAVRRLRKARGKLSKHPV